MFVAGIVLWLAGVPDAAALRHISLIGFAVVAWREVAPQGCHVYDTELRVSRV